MSTTTLDPAVLRYVEAVRLQLDDLPVAERDELLEDLEDHLAEVAAEDDGTLEERLGPPAAYAEELRASAGYPSREELAARRPAQKLAERISASPMWRSVSRVIESSQGRAMLRFARELRPGWWVLRGYLAVVVAGAMTSQQRNGSTLLPFIDGLPPVGIFLILTAVALSVWLGRRSERSGRARFLSIAFSLAVVTVSAGAAAGWNAEYPYYGEDVGYLEEQPFLQHADGSAISNICPYSADGKLLNGVLLYDEQGRPIVNTAQPPAYAGLPPAPPSGPTNVYPRTSVVVELYDPTGTSSSIVEMSCPPALAAQPSPSSQAPGAPPGD